MKKRLTLLKNFNILHMTTPRTINQSYSSYAKSDQVNEQKKHNFFTTNSIIRAAIKIKGTLLFRKFEKISMDSQTQQPKMLLKILKKNQETKMGRDLKYKDIKTLEDFQKNIPIMDYEDHAPYVDQIMSGKKNVMTKNKIINYATTSGSTGQMKFIPQTTTLQKANSNLGKLFAYTLLKELPSAYNHKVLAIVSPACEGHAKDGKEFGSTSGMFLRGLGGIVAKLYACPYDLLAIEDYKSRYFSILIFGLTQNISIISTANPSTLLLLAEKMNEYFDDLFSTYNTGNLPSWIKVNESQRNLLEEKILNKEKLAQKILNLKFQDQDNLLRPSDIWPQLEAVTCWTSGNCSNFISKMHQWYGNVRYKDLGYLATELRGTIPLECDNPAGALTLHENFYEFIPEEEQESDNPKVLLAHELEVGKRYSIIFTTKNGLVRYRIRDIIEVKSFFHQNPCIVFVQKEKGITNITGEKLYEQQVSSALNNTESKLKYLVNFGVLVANVDCSRYDFYCEFNDVNLDKNQKNNFLKLLDQNLSIINCEYKTKRASLRLKDINLIEVPKKSFEKHKAWRIAHGVREGQFKLPLLMADKEELGPIL
jgi:hypothetical protein